MFIRRPKDEYHGVQLFREAGSTPGTIYPMLEFMKAQGWITDRWETAEQARDRDKRARPRHYWKVVPNKLPEMINYVKRWDDRARGLV